MGKKEWYGIIECVVVLIVIVSGKKDNADDLVVAIPNPYGRVQGHILKSESGKDYYAFQEIPYALAPIGKHRFQVPKRHNEWHSILDATNNSKICIQTLDENPFNLNVTEDCLYLNIYTPKKPGSDTDLLPVLLWVHPGDFMTGSGVFQYYGPQYLMDYGVIVVTMNYRLGPLGFLWAGDMTIPGNLGLRDQLFAFEWLLDNVQVFGGDPEGISFVGQGSGAASVSYQAINGHARDTVFRTAIMQSGSSLSPYYFQPEPIKYAFDLAQKLDSNFSSTDTQDLRDLLVGVGAWDIQEAGEEIMRSVGNNDIFQQLVWLPVLEGYIFKNAFLAREMLECYTTGRLRITPIMVGFTSEEMVNVGAKENITYWANLYDNEPGRLVNAQLQVATENRTPLGKEIKALYTNSTFKDDADAFITFLSDQVTTPIIKQVYNSSWFNINYLYQFSYKGDFENASTIPDLQGANTVASGTDLQYMWYNGINITGTFSEEDKETQKRLLTLWTNFIKYMDPTPNLDSLLQNVTWNYLPERGTNYLNINTNLEVMEDPKRFSAINDIYNKYLLDTEPLTVF